MAHYVWTEDAAGDLLTAVPACGEYCARDVSRALGIAYAGWNGAHEGGDAPEYCAGCGVRCVVGIETECYWDCLYPWARILAPAWQGPRAERVPGACPHGIAYAVPLRDARGAHGVPAEE